MQGASCRLCEGHPLLSPRESSKDEAESRAWATVNKQSGGGERKGGSGQKTSGESKSKARKASARRASATRRGVSRPGQKLKDVSKMELMSLALDNRALTYKA